MLHQLLRTLHGGQLHAGDHARWSAGALCGFGQEAAGLADAPRCRMMGAITRIGLATSKIFFSLSSLTIPTVFIGRIARYTSSAQNRFLSVLCSTVPYPVSSTASRANGS